MIRIDVIYSIMNDFSNVAVDMQRDYKKYGQSSQGIKIENAFRFIDHKLYPSSFKSSLSDSSISSEEDENDILSRTEDP